MNNKLSLSLFLFSFLFLIPLVHAGSFGYGGTATNYYGTYQQNTNVRIPQICTDATYITLTSISYPDGSVAVSHVNMTDAGSGEWFYDFNLTSQLGRYDIRGVSDGCEGAFVTYFEVTLSGNKSPDGIVIVIFSIIFIAMVVFGIVYFLKCLARVVEFDMDLIDTAYLMSIYFAIWIFHAFSYDYLGNTLIYNLLDIFIKIGAFTHVFLAIVGFMVSYIVTTLRFKQKQKTTY